MLNVKLTFQQMVKAEKTKLFTGILVCQLAIEFQALLNAYTKFEVLPLHLGAVY